jgi:hypothetical protein
MSKKLTNTKGWTGHDAAQWMAVAHMSGKRGVKGMCLKTCRLAWQIPAKYPSAIVAWNNTPKKHKFTDPMKAPKGQRTFGKVASLAMWLFNLINLVMCGLLIYLSRTQ